MPVSRNVFLVDDDAAVCHALTVFLETSGYAVRSFSSAEAFLQAVDEVTEGIMLLDQRMTGMTGLELQALDAYRAATVAWPDDTSSWQALGNMAYKAGNNDEAVAALLKASSLSPDDVAAWNNLAYALHMNGCTEQAFMSLQCAYQLSPDDENIRDSEQEIHNMAMQPQTGSCPEITCN